MAKATALLAERGLTARTIIAGGRPADAILETARELGADLVVVGSSGRHGAARLLLGSVSSAVAAHAGVSVLIVR
jgi:nucleotide-binding universal stress UspA family protein